MVADLAVRDDPVFFVDSSTDEGEQIWILHRRAQLEPSAKAQWTKRMLFTGSVGAALTGPAATETAMAAAGVMRSTVSFV